MGREGDRERGGRRGTAADPFKYISFSPYTITSGSASPPLSFIIDTQWHSTDSSCTCITRKHTRYAHAPRELLCQHTHARTHTHTGAHRHNLRSDPPVFDGPIHVAGDVVDSPLPCRPSFKPPPRGCLSPGEDCIFYLSLFSLAGFPCKKFGGENCNQHNRLSSRCVLACHSLLLRTCKDVTNNTHTHILSPLHTPPFCASSPLLSLSLLLALSLTHKHTSPSLVLPDKIRDSIHIRQTLEIFALLKQISLMPRNLVNRPDRSWSGAPIVHHNTFSEPTRAEAQHRDSSEAERGGREGGERSCIKSCLQIALEFR